MARMRDWDFDSRNTLEFFLIGIPDLSESDSDELGTLLGKRVELFNWQLAVRALLVEAAFHSALPNRANLIEYYEKVSSHATALADLLRSTGDEPIDSLTLVQAHVRQHLNNWLVHDPEEDLPLHMIMELIDQIAKGASAWAREFKTHEQGHAGRPVRAAFKKLLHEIVGAAHKAGDDLTLPGHGNWNPLFRYICRAVDMATSSAEAVLEQCPLAEDEKRVAKLRLRGYRAAEDDPRALLDSARACVRKVRKPLPQRRRRRAKIN